MKRTERISETSGTILNTPTFELYGSQKKRKRKGLRGIFEEIIVKLPNMRKEIAKSRKHREFHIR